MKLKKIVAGTLAGAVVAGSASVALATSASAVDDGSLIAGNLYILSSSTGLAGSYQQDVLTSGTNAKAWQTVATDASCPAGTIQTSVNVRLPAGADETNWAEAQMSAESAYTHDAKGAYQTADFDTVDNGSIQSFLLAYTTPQALPISLICWDSHNNPVGHIDGSITIAPVDASGNTTWTMTPTGPALPSKPLPVPTIAVSATPTTAEVGDSVALSATVTKGASSSAVPTGTVTFTSGSVALGSGTLDSSGTVTVNTTALPQGTDTVTATYAGDSKNAGATGTTSVTISKAADRSTTSVLTVDKVSGDPYQTVTLTDTVTASKGSAVGTVTFYDGTTTLGSAPVSAGVATLTVSSLAAATHALTASFVGTAPYDNSTSNEVDATYAQTAAHDNQTVKVTVPTGTLTIETPYTPTYPLDLGTAVLDPATNGFFAASAVFKPITINDTRTGNLGFTGTLKSTDFTGSGSASFSGNYAGLTGLGATQVSGNALQAGDLVITQLPAGTSTTDTNGLGTAKTFVSYPAGKAIGTASLAGTFSVHIPTSVAPGTYTATEIFTAF